MWKERPPRASTPRRLARTKHPNGGVWVVHAVYLEKDTMDRDRSYFSHMLHLSTADPAAVLRSWDAPGWVKEYARGADKTLPRGRLPIGSTISDDTLAAFLSAGPLNGSAELSVAVCPTRLRASAEARRELTARFLEALILTEQSRDRDRLFVHAEPGLVAILLYAAVRLLPPAWTVNLTFSTFEPHHRGIQDYKLATVVGTYLGAPGNGLDRELVAARGFGLDTVLPNHSSDELSGPFPPGLGELIDLAANGEWQLLAEVHNLIGADADALGQVNNAVALARGVSRLSRGEPTIDDLLALRGDPRGAESLAHLAEMVWPHVRAAALTDAYVWRSRTGWPSRRGSTSSAARPRRRWRRRSRGLGSRWVVVAKSPTGTPEVQVEKVLRTWTIICRAGVLPARALREACRKPVYGPSTTARPDECGELNICSPRDAAEWQGYTCFAVMGPDEKNWLLRGRYHSARRCATARKFLFARPSACSRRTPAQRGRTSTPTRCSSTACSAVHARVPRPHGPVAPHERAGTGRLVEVDSGGQPLRRRLGRLPARRRPARAAPRRARG